MINLTNNIMELPKNKIGAIIVLYNPSIDSLDCLINSIYYDVDKIYLVDNSLEPLYEFRYDAESKITHIRNKENLGIAKALNIGASEASTDNCNYIITFDQDSNPGKSMIPTLFGFYQEIKSENKSIGAVGPALVDNRGDLLSFPFLKFGRFAGFYVDHIFPNVNIKYLNVDLLITSGMFFDIKLWKDGFKFMDELFVDYVDTEWCLRTSKAGYTHYGCPSVKMFHAVSDNPGIRIFGLLFLSYSPLRRFYYFRNTILYFKITYAPIGNRLRILIGALMRIPFIIFFDKDPINSYSSVCRGIYHGIKMKLPRA
jgi:rhamnosyltransferase